jgi:NADPH:quinone reductase-like Zn-dependent oxidoreductase
MAISSPQPPPIRQKALQVQGSGKYAVSDSVSLPPLTPTGVLVRTIAVAVNPIDAKIVDYSASAGCIGGSDFAGYIVAIGPAVQRQLSIGDRVCGIVRGCNAAKPGDGAFCEYLVAESSFLLQIPDGIPFENAAGLGTAIVSVGMSLYQSIGLPFPSLDGRGGRGGYALVYGGSTSCGTLAIQMLKL